MAKNIFLCLFVRRERSHPPRRGPGPLVMGVARAECRFRRLHGRQDRAIIRLSCLLMIPLTLGLIKRPTAGRGKTNVMQHPRNLLGVGFLRRVPLAVCQYSAD